MNLLKRREKTDWMAVYNRALAEQGESTEILCAQLNKQDRTIINWIRYDHQEMDGFGSFCDGLRQEGYQVDFPVSEWRKSPPFLKLFPYLLLFLKNDLWPVKPLPWRFSHPDRPYQVFGKVFHIFSESESFIIKKRARALRVNYSSLLLHALNAAVNEVLMITPTLNRWHIPVNMRPYFQCTSEKSNNLSNFILSIKSDESLDKLFHTQTRELEFGTFFATYFFLTLGDYWGFKNLLPKKVKTDYRQPGLSPKMTGTFSNLGSWPLRGEKTKRPNETLVGFGNVSKMNPICAVNLEWDKQISITLQVHSTIVDGIENVTKLMQIWLRNIESE